MSKITKRLHARFPSLSNVSHISKHCVLSNGPAKVICSFQTIALVFSMIDHKVVFNLARKILRISAMLTKAHMLQDNARCAVASCVFTYCRSWHNAEDSVAWPAKPHLHVHATSYLATPLARLAAEPAPPSFFSMDTSVRQWHSL